LQKLVYNKDADSATETIRRRAFGIDPLSFELLYLSSVAATAIALWEISMIVSLIVISVATLIRITAEYFWFSDRPDRWLSLRFRIYRMRRKLRPSISERLQKILVSEVDKMKGRDFEYYVADLLMMIGFKKVKVTKGSGDYGVDITDRKSVV
jgi:hypothetical protein